MIDGAIMPGLDGRIGDEPRMAVGRVHACRAAERIAGKLIEQDDERQCAVGTLGPAGQLAARGRLMCGKEAIAKALVERVVLREPEAGSGLPPEIDDGACLGRNLGARSSAGSAKPLAASAISSGNAAMVGLSEKRLMTISMVFVPVSDLSGLRRQVFAAKWS